MEKFSIFRCTLCTLFTAASMSAMAQIPSETRILVEAEDFTDAIGGSVSDWTGVEGSQASGKKGASADKAYLGNYLEYNVESPAAGWYDLDLRYVTMNTRWAEIKINDQNPYMVACDILTPDWNGKPSAEYALDGVASKKIRVYLNKGNNSMVVSAVFGYSPEVGRDQSYMPNIDCFIFTPAEDQSGDASVALAQIRREAEDRGGGNGATDNRSGFVGQKGASFGSNDTAFANYNNYTVGAPESGFYKLTLHYATCQRRWLGVKVNGGEAQYLCFCADDGEKTPDWDGVGGVYEHHTVVYLKKGSNTLTLGNYTKYGDDASEHGDSPSIDFFTLDRVEVPGMDVPRSPFYEMAISDVAEWETMGINLGAVSDHDANTSATALAADATVTLEFPYPVLVSGYAWATDDNTDNWKVELSSDGNEWTTREYHSQDNPYIFKNPLDGGRFAYNFVRLTLPEGATLADFVVFGNPCASDDFHLPEGLIAQGFEDYTSTDPGLSNFGEVIANVFDGKTNTKYTTQDKVKAFDIEVKLGEPAVVRSYMMTTHFSPSYYKRSPRVWTLDAKDENGEYVTIDSRDNGNFGVPGAALVAEVKDNELSSDSYRLSVKENMGDNDHSHLSGFQLFATSRGPVSGAEAVDENAVVAVAGLEGGIAVMAAEADYAVYSISGAQIAVGSVKDAAHIAAAPGIYVVRVADKAFKVVVK